MPETIIKVNERQLDTIMAALRHFRDTRWRSFPTLMSDDEINALLDTLAADQPVFAAARGCGLCGSTALPDSKLCGPCSGIVVDRGPSVETLARECAAAVATRKLGDTPRECSPKGMALGSIIPHHPPADPTDATTLTGEERQHLRTCRDLGGEG